jgi:hypothetical protein
MIGLQLAHNIRWMNTKSSGVQRWQRGVHSSLKLWEEAGVNRTLIQYDYTDL